MGNKRVLLIAGAGTLGGNTYPELLRLGYSVDIISLEDFRSQSKNLRYIKGRVTDDMLRELFRENHYDAIVDFIHYENPEEYKKRGALLLENTDQLVFLSSYRVYADMKGAPITEESPQLLNVSTDEYFLKTECYAIPKSKNENFIRSTGKKNYTIIRPLISFSHYRLDLVTQGAWTILPRSREGKPILLPEGARKNIAGVGWAGNVGRMIANLIGKEDALGEAFTLGAGEMNTWEDVAGYYTELLGSKFLWVDDETYLQVATGNDFWTRCSYLYDRAWDRRIDNAKVLRVTGLKKEELVSTHDGIVKELVYLSENPELADRFDTPWARELNEKIDAWLGKSF